MRDICSLLWCGLVGLFPSRASLEAEILLLRHQLNILRRKSPKRMAFTDVDRLVFARLYHLASEVLSALKIGAGDRDPLAPRWLPGLVAQEIRATRGLAADTARDTPVHSGC